MIFDKIKLLVDKIKDMDADDYLDVYKLIFIIFMISASLGGILSFFTLNDAFSYLGLPFFLLFQLIYLGLCLFGIFLTLGFLYNTFKETESNDFELENILKLLIVFVGSIFICGGLIWFIYIIIRGLHTVIFYNPI